MAFEGLYQLASHPLGSSTRQRQELQFQEIVDRNMVAQKRLARGAPRALGAGATESGPDGFDGRTGGIDESVWQGCLSIGKIIGTTLEK